MKLGKREWRANASEINDDVSLSIVGAVVALNPTVTEASLVAKEAKKKMGILPKEFL